MSNVNEQIKKSLSFLDNPYVSGTLTLIIILYASLAAPKLPHNIAKIFNHNLFKLLFCFLIVYFSVKDVSIAIILSIALIVSLQTFNRLTFEEQIRQWTRLSLNDTSSTMSPYTGEFVSLPERQGSGRMSVGSQAVMQPQVMENTADMPMDVAFETGTMPTTCRGPSTGIVGADPDEESYGVY